MKERSLLPLFPILLGVALLVNGCGSTGPSKPKQDKHGPQTFLSGAEVQQAVSLAKGSAVTKGWRVAESSPNGLLVRRPLSTTMAESVTGAPVSTALVQVKTDFHERRQGVAVVVRAALITDEGTKTQRTIDFTDAYMNELNQSLDALKQSWEENRLRVASATPPKFTKEVAPEDESTEGAPDAIEGGQIADTAADPLPEEATAWPETPTASAESVAASSTGSDPVPARDGQTAAAPPPAADSTLPLDPAENMLALNRTADLGVWAYYAEHYAKIRGCDLAGNGAILEEKQPDYEIHRVYCEDNQDFLVKCNAGTCRGLD